MAFMRFVLLLVTLIPAICLAIPETDYASSYKSTVMPFYQTIGQVGTLRGDRNMTLKYVQFVNPSPRGVIVIATGFNESFRKYAEVSYDLFMSGYSVYILDHRGQGASERFLKDSMRGYVDQFGAFVADLKKFVSTVVPQDKAIPHFLLAHSMGGAIAALYLERYPQDFRAAALSSPMMKINLGMWESEALVKLEFLNLLGKGSEYAPKSGPYDPKKVDFTTNTLTGSAPRFYNNEQILVDDPTLFLAGPTVHWLLEAIPASQQARAWAGWATTPVLLLQAGADQIVLNEGENNFCASAPHCTLLRFEDAKHEILQESDRIRQPALDAILAFFAKSQTQ